jgi:hypothetical protein
MDSERLVHLQEFYSLLNRLEQQTGGAQTLGVFSDKVTLPKRGVYFFREHDEPRSNSGLGQRIVRVGTHAVISKAKSTLRSRLSQHRGQKKSGGGNHRGSIFRLLVGTSLIERDGLLFPTWDKGSSAPSETRAGEVALELEVTRVIGAMPFLWLAIEDEPGPGSLRAYIERNSIALLSNFERSPLDPPSPGWLGHYCNRERVRKSGLWNSDHVEKSYDHAFLQCLDKLVSGMAVAA